MVAIQYAVCVWMNGYVGFGSVAILHLGRRRNKVAEPLKAKKVSLRDILDEIAEDNAFSDEEMTIALEKVRELEYERWCAQQLKQGH